MAEDKGETGGHSPEELAAAGAQIAYQNAAREAQLFVQTALDTAQAVHPEQTTAIVTGAMAAVVQHYHDKTMAVAQVPTVRALNLALFPIINKLAEQIVPGGKG